MQNCDQPGFYEEEGYEGCTSTHPIVETEGAEGENVCHTTGTSEPSAPSAPPHENVIDDTGRYTGTLEQRRLDDARKYDIEMEGRRLANVAAEERAQNEKDKGYILLDLEMINDNLYVDPILDCVEMSLYVAQSIRPALLKMEAEIGKLGTNVIVYRRTLSRCETADISMKRWKLIVYYGTDTENVVHKVLKSRQRVQTWADLPFYKKWVAKKPLPRHTEYLRKNITQLTIMCESDTELIGVSNGTVTPRQLRNKYIDIPQQNELRYQESKMRHKKWTYRKRMLNRSNVSSRAVLIFE